MSGHTPRRRSTETFPTRSAIRARIPATARGSLPPGREGSAVLVSGGVGKGATVGVASAVRVGLPEGAAVAVSVGLLVGVGVAVGASVGIAVALGASVGVAVARVTRLFESVAEQFSQEPPP